LKPRPTSLIQLICSGADQQIEAQRQLSSKRRAKRRDNPCLVIARAARHGNPGGLLDRHGPAGFALTAVLFELPLVDPL
jgi:hypothetical protein